MVTELFDKSILDMYSAFRAEFIKKSEGYNENDIERAFLNFVAEKLNNRIDGNEWNRIVHQINKIC